MRLAYLSTDPGVAWGGTEGASVHLAAIVDALAEDDNDVLVLVSAVGPAGTFPMLGAELEPLPAEGAGGLERRLAEFGAEALYERLALQSSAGSIAARRLGIPHLLELNAPLPEEAVRNRRLEDPGHVDRLEREALAQADAVFAVSPPLAEYARNRGARRVEVLQNAAAVELFRTPERTDGAPAAAFAGSVSPWHGLEIAEAWTILGSEAPRLLVIGDGPGCEPLRRVGATFVGRVLPDRVPELLAKAEIGLAPFSADAPDYMSPLKLFDYLAAGLATVVGDLPAARAVVGPDSGVVIPRGDARALADAVAALVADPERRRRLGENGRALVEAEHTWKHRARRIVDLAGEVARARPVQA